MGREKIHHAIALTWSPNSKLQADRPEWSYSKQLPCIRLLRRCCNDVIVSPELFQSGGMHWHAQLVISDKIKWFKTVLPTLKHNGFVKIKTDVDEGWLDYVKKDNEMMEQILDLSKGTLPLTLEALTKRERVGQHTLLEPDQNCITKWFKRKVIIDDED